MKKLIGKSVLALLAIVVCSTSAMAIKCNGRYQVMRDGSEINSPFCNDNYLAAIGRQSGHSYTARQIRRNPSLKAELCDNIGDDSRVEDICATVRFRPSYTAR